jgi:fatty acid desaturase
MSPTSENSFRKRPVEWPTVAVIAIVYLVLGLLTWHHASLPWWIILPVGAYAAALHSSLQHEVLHGHPTRNRLLNEALVFVTPAMWLPFQRYKETHLAHHNDINLTDPVKDPESYYMLPESWAALPGLKQTLYQMNHTLAGRMAMGPAISIIQFWGTELAEVLRGDADKAKAWAGFAIACTLTLIWVVGVCGMPFWKYYLLVAYPGVSLALVRSYCEHQAAEQVNHRTIVVDASPFWSLLFLNNNLHVAHHEKPTLAWYKLPAFYEAERQRLLEKNNGYRMTYWDIFRRYALRAKEPIPYPNINWLKR